MLFRDVFQIGFLIDFGALRDPLGLQKTSNIILVLHENKVFVKIKKGALGELFWFDFRTLLEHFVVFSYDFLMFFSRFDF